MLVIGIIAPKASGKETVARYIAEKYMGKHHSHSEILDDVLDILRIPKSRENEMKLIVLRKTFGPNVLTNALNKKIKNEGVDVQVVTGIRFQSELDNIREYPKNKIIYLDAPLEKRYEWQLTRAEKADDANMTFEHFQELDERETERDIKKLGENADYKVSNDGDKDQLFAKIDAVMKEILQ